MSNEIKLYPRYNSETEQALRDFTAEVEQLCKDFSDLRDRPYMGDVTNALDSLLEQCLKTQEPPACCTPTVEELKLLADGDYRPEELWGGSRPTRPKCHKAEPAAFERENRYIVLKRKRLAYLPEELQARLKPALEDAAALLPKLECVVVESHWPEYEPTWAAIAARVAGARAK